MAGIQPLLAAAREMGCSDLHLTAGIPPVVRVDGQLRPLAGQAPLTPEAVADLAGALRAGAGMPPAAGPMEDQDFAYVDGRGARYRVNLYRQQGAPAAAVRLLSDHIPTLAELGLPPVLSELAALPRGLVLVTGPTGSGKSTTLAAMIDAVNRARTCHILTLEDPVEYRYTPQRSMVNQRELGRDTPSFAAALKSALREDPDVILVGEMRDLETIAAAVTAAETGHLVLSTLHTTGAAATIDRIVDVFPPYQQQQIRTQLAAVLRGVVSQQLLPRARGGGRTAAAEVLVVSDAAATLIRDNKCHQLGTVLQTGARLGCQSMDMALAALCRAGQVSPEAAEAASIDRETFRRLAGLREG